MSRNRIIVLIVIVAAIAAFFALGLDRYFTLEEVKARQAEFAQLLAARPLTVAAAYFVIYVAVTALSLPGAALMTVLGGALLGLFWGVVIVSFASSIGATLAFLVSRFLFRDAVQAKFADKLGALNRGVARDGGFYLFTLRLIPVFPFFMINLAMGLTPMRTRTFYWVSQLGMLAGTIVYVNVGTQLAQLESLQGILSPMLLGSFAAIGLLPLVAHRVVDALRRRRVYARWTRPRRFDRNLVVIGAGSAGLVSSYIAAAVKARVTLVERHKMGGDCLNYGCMPSKALIRSAKLLHQARHASRYGIRSLEADFDFADVMERVARVVKTVAPHDSVERYTELGVECLIGDAKIVSPWEVEVRLAGSDGAPGERTRVLTTRNIIVATGAAPLVPPIPGIDEVGYLSSDTVWGLRERPRRLLVLGGGPIGCELAQAFARLGAQVTLVEMAPRLMLREDTDVSDLVLESFVDDGIDVRVNHKALRFVLEDGERKMIAERTDTEGETVEIGFDQMLCALGRSPRVTGFGLEELGIPVARNRTIEVNEFLETNYPNIYACGDVTGPYQFTHTAAHMAWFASVNALFGRFKRFRVDYSVIPWCTFTSPEVARVGINEQEAKEKGIPVEVTRYGIDDLDRAIADESAYGFVKVLTRPNSDKILGVTMVGEHAGDLIAEFVSAMKHGLGLNKILGTIHIYPTLAEANKYVAGEWKRSHAPQRLLEWVRRFHTWQLGGGGK